MHCNVQNFITLGKIPHTGIERGFCRPPKQRRMVLRRRKTVVRGECAVLVCKVFQHTSEMLVHYVLCCCRRWYRQCVRQSGDRLCTKPVSEAAVVLLRHSGICTVRSDGSFLSHDGLPHPICILVVFTRLRLISCKRTPTRCK